MAAIGTKRCHDDFDCDVSQVVESKQCKIHGIITSHSPVQTAKSSGRKYFRANISDGKKCLDIVSFNPSLKPYLDDSFAKQSPIAMLNCRVDMKDKEVIFLNEHSSVQKSPKKFTIPNDHQPNISTIQMEDLPSLANNTTVNITIKVMEIAAPESITTKAGKVYQKQDCIVGDASGCGRVVLWEEDIGRLIVGTSYTLSCVTVRCYDGVNFFSISKQSGIASVDDIGDIAKVETGDVDRPVVCRVVEGELVAVRCIKYVGCSKCKVKIENVDDVVGECRKCSSMVKLSRCLNLFTAYVRVQDQADKHHDFKMFHDIIQQIIGECKDKDVPDVQYALLAAPQLAFRVDRKNIVFSVNKL